MICMYKFVKHLIKYVDEKDSRYKNIDFFLDSMSDEKYLVMIKDKIEFLIDEGYKYSEQLNIINSRSNRSIKYATYKTYIKNYFLQQPQYSIQQNDNNFTIKDEDIELYTEKTDYYPKSKNENQESYINTSQKGSVSPLKKRNNLYTKRENISFQHEAVPNIEELY